MPPPFRADVTDVRQTAVACFGDGRDFDVAVIALEPVAARCFAGDRGATASSVAELSLEQAVLEEAAAGIARASEQLDGRGYGDREPVRTNARTGWALLATVRFRSRSIWRAVAAGRFRCTQLAAFHSGGLLIPRS